MRLQHSDDLSDIAEHLPAILFHTLMAKPRLIVELGTRYGESTRVLLQAAQILKTCRVLSVDIRDWSGSVTDADLLGFWHFELADDVDFAARFPAWCLARGYPCRVDVLFVDTSHAHLHTQREIAAWWKYLAPGAVVMFHDTNCPSVGRGVIRAIEELFGQHYTEGRAFADVQGNIAILHSPNCNGLTVLARM